MIDHFILDFETLSQNPTKCAVVNVAYFKFQTTDDGEWAEQYTFDQLRDLIRQDTFQIREQMRFGYEIDPSTVDWWKSLPKDAQVQLQKTKLEDASTVRQVITNMCDMSSPNQYWWSRSNTFDPIILERLFRDQKCFPQFQKFFKFWKVRDTRSFIDGASGFKFRNDFMPTSMSESDQKSFRKHNSIDDLALDVMRLQEIW